MKFAVLAMVAVLAPSKSPTENSAAVGTSRRERCAATSRAFAPIRSCLSGHVFQVRPLSAVTLTLVLAGLAGRSYNSPGLNGLGTFF